MRGFGRMTFATILTDKKDKQTKSAGFSATPKLNTGKTQRYVMEGHFL